MPDNDFNPDQYLASPRGAQQSAGAFNPDQYLAGKSTQDHAANFPAITSESAQGAALGIPPSAVVPSGTPALPPNRYLWDAAGSLGKIPAGVVGGAMQLAEDQPLPRQIAGMITGRPSSGYDPITTALTRYSTAPNSSWLGTAMEAAGGVPVAMAAGPLGLGRAAAPLIGGLMATPSGSVPSHALGAGLGYALDLPAAGLGRMANWWRNREARLATSMRGLEQDFARHLSGYTAAERANAAREAMPQLASKTWLTDVLDGTGIAIPKGKVTGSDLTRLTDQLGTQLGAEQAKLSWHPSSDAASAMMTEGNNIAASIVDPGQRAQWQQLFAEHVLGGISSPRRPAEPISELRTMRVSGQRFASYVRSLRGEANEIWPRGDDPYARDKRKIANGLRYFADYAEEQAEGGDKTALRNLRTKFARLSTLNRASDATRGSVATPRSILAERLSELSGNDATLRRMIQQDPVLRRIARMQQIHEGAQRQAPPTPQPPFRASPYDQHAAASAAAHLGHAATGLPHWPLYLAFRSSLGDMAMAARRLAGRGATSRAGSALAQLPPGIAGAGGGVAGQTINQFFDQSDQSPTGGMTP